MIMNGDRSKSGHSAKRTAHGHPRSARGWLAMMPVLLLGAALALPAHAQLPVTSRRNERESFSNAQVDQALQRATNAIAPSCPTSFFRQTNLGTFVGPNNPGTARDIDAVLNTFPSLVKVVNDITFCARSNVNIIGCALTGRGTMAVEDVSDPGNGRQNPALDGVLWAHEYGHAIGLPHRSSSTALMNPTITTATTLLNSNECGFFLANDLRFNIGFTPSADGPIISGSGPEAEEEADPDAPPMPIEEFVKRIMIDETPVDEIVRYGSADLPRLRRMLSDRRAIDTWPMVTTVLGMIGSDTTASELIAFIETRRAGRISRAEYNGIRSAIQALGFLANRAGSRVALDYIMKASDPGFWGRQRSMRWISVATPSVGRRDHKLANVAAIGLGLSGDTQAMTMLRARWNETLRGRASQTQEEQQEMLGLLEQAMSDNAKISRVGLIDYYRE
jgi:hypothetical protein